LILALAEQLGGPSSGPGMVPVAASAR